MKAIFSWIPFQISSGCALILYDMSCTLQVRNTVSKNIKEARAISYDAVCVIR